MTYLLICFALLLLTGIVFFILDCSNELNEQSQSNYKGTIGSNGRYIYLSCVTTPHRYTKLATNELTLFGIVDRTDRRITANNISAWRQHRPIHNIVIEWPESGELKTTRRRKNKQEEASRRKKKEKTHIFLFPFFSLYCDY